MCVGCATRAASTCQRARVLKVIDDKFVRNQVATCYRFAKNARAINRSLHARTPAVHARCRFVHERIRALHKALPTIAPSTIKLSTMRQTPLFIHCVLCYRKLLERVRGVGCGKVYEKMSCGFVRFWPGFKNN